MSTLAVVLAGGLGTRLRGVVPDLPKCLSPVGGRPFLRYLLEHLRGQGVTQVVLAVGYRGAEIRATFGDGADIGLDIDYVDDGEVLRGTGGALAHALRAVPRRPDEDLLVLNGDTYVEFDLPALVRVAESPAARLVIVGARVDDLSRFGGMEIGANGEVVRFTEKGEVRRGVISAGVYYCRRKTLEALLPAREAFSLETDVLTPLAGHGLFAVESRGRFVDIGVPEGYREAESLLSNRTVT